MKIIKRKSDLMVESVKTISIENDINKLFLDAVTLKG